MAYFLSQTKNKPEQSGLCSDVVEAGGIEPPSENPFRQLSPSAAYRLAFPRPAADRQAVGVSSLLFMAGVKASSGHVHYLFRNAGASS